MQGEDAPYTHDSSMSKPCLQLHILSLAPLLLSQSQLVLSLVPTVSSPIQIMCCGASKRYQEAVSLC